MSGNLKIAQNSLIIYTKLIITFVVGLVSTRYVLLNLGVSDYGLYSVVGSVVVMVGFFNNAIVSTTYRYIAFEMGSEGGNVNRIFNISLIIHLAMGMLLVLLGETAGVWYIKEHLTIDAGKLGDALVVFRLSVLATVINFVSLPYQGFLTAIEKFSVRAAIEIARSVIHLGLVILLGLVLANKLVIYAIMMVGLTILETTTFIVYCRKYYGQFVVWYPRKDKAKYLEMIGFTGWVAFGSAANLGKDFGSQLIINAFYGTLLNAAFGIAFKLNSFVKLFAQSLGQVIIPQITKSHSSGEHNRSKQLVAHISKYSFFLFYLPALPLLLETRFVLGLWLGEVPDYTVSFVKLMLVNGLIDSLTAGVQTAVQVNGKIKWFQIIISTIMLASLPVTYWLFTIGLPPYSINIVYISSAIINLFVSIYLLKLILDFDIKYLFVTSYLKIFLVLVLTLPLILIIPQFESSVQRFVVSSTSSLILLPATIYFFGISQKERNFLYKFISKIITQLGRFPSVWK